MCCLPDCLQDQQVPWVSRNSAQVEAYSSLLILLGLQLITANDKYQFV